MVNISHDDHMIDTPTSTILVEPDCSAWLTKYGDVKLKVSLCMCVGEGACAMCAGGWWCKWACRHHIGRYTVVDILSSIHEHSRADGQVT